MAEMAEQVFEEPTKQIKSVADLATWKKSQAYSDYMGFVRLMNTTVKGKKLTDECNVSEVCQKLIEMIDTLEKWAEEIPPLQQPQRYGNQAFRTWHTKLKENSESLIKEVLPKECQGACIELKAYLTEGFGNFTRIDYGTGHEMNYATFLCCLFKLRVLTEADSEAIVHRVFDRYLRFMRTLQKRYCMEPAGSQGVWGLDDFQFLPYIWGSSQFIGHPKVFPKDFVDPEVSHFHKDDYMFMGCIEYINEVKTGPFAEHSNQLWNISGVMHWTKVNSGLIKMYMEEPLIEEATTELKTRAWVTSSSYTFKPFVIFSGSAIGIEALDGGGTILKWIFKNGTFSTINRNYRTEIEKRGRIEERLFITRHQIRIEV